MIALPSKNKSSVPFFSFKINEKLEKKIKEYISTKKEVEISGGLIGDIKGGKKNNIIFDVKDFLPFPNLAQDQQNFSKPPNFWFEILEEWRVFSYKSYKFLGFLHTHPQSTSKFSEQDEKFANSLKEKYGSVIFIIIGENKNLRCYLFKDNRVQLIPGITFKYKLIK